MKLILNFSKSNPLLTWPKVQDKNVNIFFSSGFSFTDTDNSQDNRGREGTIFYFTLPLPPAHEHSDIYFQLCKWDGYDTFLIATLVFTRLLLDEIYHLIELLSDWLMMWYWFLFICLLNWFKVLLQLFDMRNRWMWTCVDYHPCITSEPTNQVCQAFFMIFKGLLVAKNGLTLKSAPLTLTGGVAFQILK